MRMKKLAALATVAGGLTVATVGGPASADPPSSWGQEVRACNQSSCYPGGGSRGSYVSEQARDDQGPGYGYEIQTLANPGRPGR